MQSSGGTPPHNHAIAFVSVVGITVILLGVLNFVANK